MKIKRNQVFLTFTFAIIIGWMFYTRRYSTYNPTAKDAIIEHVKNTDFNIEDIDELLVIKLINDYTGDEKIIKKFGDLLEENDKEKILDYLKKI